MLSRRFALFLLAVRSKNNTMQSSMCFHRDIKPLPAMYIKETSISLVVGWVLKLFGHAMMSTVGDGVD